MANRHFHGFPAAARIADFVPGVVSVDEILHDAAAFEDADFLPVGVGVCQGGNAAVWVDGREPGGFLLVRAHVDFTRRVWEAELGERNTDFDAVWRLTGVEGNVWLG